MPETHQRNTDRGDGRLQDHASEPKPVGSSGSADRFTRLSAESDPGLIREFVEFLKYNKKWWLTPILVVTLLLIGAAILLPSPVMPFIYTLF